MKKIILHGVKEPESVGDVSHASPHSTNTEAAVFRPSYGTIEPAPLFGLGPETLLTHQEEHACCHFGSSNYDEGKPGQRQTISSPFSTLFPSHLSRFPPLALLVGFVFILFFLLLQPVQG